MPPELTSPEGLKYLVPGVITFIAALIGLVTAFTTTLLAHSLKSKSERNTIKVKKAYDLAEDIAGRLQKIDTRYRYLAEFWLLNFGHLDSRAKGIEAFKNKSQSVYPNEVKAINNLSLERTQLEKALLGAWLYLPDKVVQPIEDYLDLGRFAFKTDGIGFVDTAIEEFLENLLKPENIIGRKTKLDEVKKAMRRMKL